MCLFRLTVIHGWDRASWIVSRFLKNTTKPPHRCEYLVHKSIDFAWFILHAWKIKSFYTSWIWLCLNQGIQHQLHQNWPSEHSITSLQELSFPERNISERNTSNLPNFLLHCSSLVNSTLKALRIKGRKHSTAEGLPLHMGKISIRGLSFLKGRFLDLCKPVTNPTYCSPF